MNEVMLFLIFAGGKNFAKNFCAKLAQIAMDPCGNKLNLLLALSRREKGKRLNFTGSSDTPLNLKVSDISKKLLKFWLG